ncbi:glycosyltransferase [Solirubrobacter taibaiensis]|nr:glycosyltransferase [Solirubrobacter taibaiensis]
MISVLEAIPAAPRRASGQIRVASVPAGHVYVRHLSAPDGGDAVVRLPDIPPADGCRVPGGWWPPAMLDAEWIAAHHGTFDVFHVHFGFDAKTPAELRAIADALERAGIPLVVTVHDLRNPHHPSPELHDAQLGVLISRAAAVLTLTPGAAREIKSRWGRDATVLAHPHVVDWDTMARPRPVHDGFVVGLHAKSVRANMGIKAVSAALVEAVGSVRGGRLQINVHHEVFEPGSHYYDPVMGAFLRTLASAVDIVELVEHEYFSDDELWAYLASIDVSVLPYRFGTHSGWLEACVDLGTAVIAPSCGFYAEQQPVFEYQHDEGGLDARSLKAAVRAAYYARPGRRASVVERREQRCALSAAHEAVYARVLR